MLKRVLLASIIAGAEVCLAGCGLLGGDQQIDEGVVIAPKLMIRSSTATVALELAEARRGDRLEILEQTEVKTPTRIDEWYKVRTKAKDPITGWVQARYLINKAVVDKIDELYEKSKPTVSQGTGRLKVQTRLRVEPGGDVATHLSRGTYVEIVAKARTVVKPEKQQAPEDTDEPSDEPEARTVLWYQIRLAESEVLRSGWVGAQQVQLDVPDEILHLEGEGRRFTGWVVYDQVRTKKGELKNTYIGLMKSVSTEGPIDFTRLWVLNYSPDEGRYTGSYIEDKLRGLLPITVRARGFTINEMDESDKPVEVQYEATRVDANHLRIRRLAPKFQIKKQVKKQVKKPKR